jgi:hypothetical protein
LKNDQGDTPSDLGMKVGIDTNDLDHVWMSSKLTGSIHCLGMPRKKSLSAAAVSLKDSSATILPGGDFAQEFTSQFDSRILKLLQSPLSFEECQKFVTSISEKMGTPKISEKRRKTITAVDKNASPAQVTLEEAHLETDDKTDKHSKRAGTVRMPFKLFSRKRADELKRPDLPNMFNPEAPNTAATNEFDYHNPEVGTVDQKN